MQDKLKQGEALFAEGKIEEAEKCFLEILEHDHKNKEACNNLGVIVFQKQDAKQAIFYFTRALKIDPFYKDAVLNYCDVLGSLSLAHEAIPFLEKVVQKYPDDQQLSQLLHKASLTQQPRKKIAVLCLPGLQSFLGDIVDYLKTKYDVRTCYSNNNQEIESAIRWADVVWIEWANELTVAITNHPTMLDSKCVICRLHSYEAFAGYAKKINWDKISDLIFVAKHIKDIVLQQVPSLSNRVKNIHIVPNGIDLDRFPFKDSSKGTNLAYAGHINYKKGPMLLLHAFRELVAVDKKYKLFIAGDFQDARYQLYFNQMIKEMNLDKNVQIDGWIKDVNTWFEDKNYIVSTSLLESQQLSLCEAMAKGIKPVIHNFVGAKGVYPEKYIWDTIPEFVYKVTEDGYNSLKYRKFIEQKYSLNTQLKKIENILNTSVSLTEKHTQNKAVSFLGSSDYWEKRYNGGGTSGAGSYGKLAEFKAEVLNAFVRENDVRTVVEFGCGDGNQLSLSNYPAYIGLDVSKTAIQRCQQLFRHDKTKIFFIYEPNCSRNEHHNYRAELALSLDVIYHIIEDDAFELYMEHLFSAAERYVIIYSSDFTGYSPSPHIRYRRISEWIISRFPEWKLLEKISNRYPYKGDDRTGSLSDFYIYRKSCSNSALKGIAPNGDNAKKNDQVVSFIHEGQEVRLMLSDTDEHLSGIIRSHKNFYELQMLDDIRKRVPPLGVFVDCGANIGNHAVYFGVICEASKVYAFEPTGGTYNILLKNISLNKLESTIVGYNIALGKENTNGSLIVQDARNLGTSKIQECPEGDIVIRKLDDIVFADNDSGFEGIDLIKIDVEGMELDVLQGAKKVLNKFLPMLYVEIQTDDKFRAIVDFLSPYGYEPKLRFNWTPTFLFETNKRRR